MNDLMTVNINGQLYRFEIKTKVDVEIVPVEPPKDFASKLAFDAINNVLDKKSYEIAKEIEDYVTAHWNEKVKKESQ